MVTSHSDPARDATLAVSEATRVLAPAEASSPDREPEAALAPSAPLLPPKIGRFTLVRKLGEGGMGVVYMAYDEALNRRVALKLLLARASDSEGLRARMQREAQALAQISHPHVVQIYDVGRHGDQVFVAMELIEGVTLKVWLKMKPRPWRDRLGALLQAGEGLSAAHQAGLIHRDMKPDNILVGDDGRVRVADFGLARSEHVAEAEPHAEAEAVIASADGRASPSSSSSSSPLNSPLTVAGTLLGTPAYMAPEQHMRRPVDSRADIFSFCVVAYEALAGHRPFKAASRAALLRAIMTGDVQPPPRECDAPARLLKVIKQGLAAEANERPSTMAALLAELRRDPARRRRRALQGVALAATIVGAGVAGAELRGPQAPSCSEAHSGALALWGEARQEAAGAAMTAIGGALGPATWARVDAEMGAYSRRLSTMLAGACERRRDGELSDHLYALEVECLERRAAELDALGELLAAADQEVTERAIDAVAKLPELEPCEDPARLLDRVAPPADPAVAAAVAELRRRLDRTRALRRLGSFKAAAASAEEAIVSARSIDYPLALAEALVEAGRAALELGEHERAAEHLFPEAMRLAERGGDDALRLDALGGLLAALGRSKAPTEMITLLAPQARALMERRGELGSLTHGRLLNGLAETYRQRQDLDGAAAAYEEAEAILSGLGVRALAELSESLNGLATIRSKQERYAEAHALYGRARAALVAALGQHHPYIGHLLNNEARAFEKEGERATARTYFERALTIWEPVYGADHLNIEIVTGHLARVTLELGDLDAAEGYALRSLAIRERDRGDKPRTEAVLMILARIAEERGALVEAERYGRRALSAAELRYGAGSPRLREPQELLARLTARQGAP